MKEFRIGPEGLKVFRKLLLKRMLIIVPIILVIAGVNLISFLGTDSHLPFTYWFFFLGPPLFFGWILFNILRKNERLFKSYVLTVENILIRREQWNTPEVDIYFNEIVEIRKTKNKWLIVKGKYAGDVIFIPPYLDNHQDLEQILQEIKPFTTKATGTFFEKYRPILSLVSIVTLIVSLISLNAIVEITCLCIYVFITIKNFIDLRKNKNIDNRARRGLWIQLIISVFLVTAIILKITGGLQTFMGFLFPFPK